MTTTPEATKGVPRLVGNPSLTLRADFNSLADYVRDRMGESVANFAALPLTGNWVGRTVLTIDTGEVYVNVGPGSWHVVNLRVDTVTPVAGAGWNAPSLSTLSKRGGFATLRYNASRSASAVAGATIVSIPVGFRASANVWGHAWGLLGAPVAVQVFFDAGANTVRVNQAVNLGEAIAMTLSWPVDS